MFHVLIKVLTFLTKLATIDVRCRLSLDTTTPMCKVTVVQENVLCKTYIKNYLEMDCFDSI